MQLETLKDSEYSFRIKSTNPNKPTVTIDCQASNPKLDKEWMDQLNKIQDEQNTFLYQLVNPQHN